MGKKDVLEVFLSKPQKPGLSSGHGRRLLTRTDWCQAVLGNAISLGDASSRHVANSKSHPRIELLSEVPRLSFTFLTPFFFQANPNNTSVSVAEFAVAYIALHCFGEAIALFAEVFSSATIIRVEEVTSSWAALVTDAFPWLGDCVLFQSGTGRTSSAYIYICIYVNIHI